MINLYPANLLENLVVLLDKVTQGPTRNLLSGEVVLVQSKGMQHWLNLSLAKQRGISMNMQFSMPVQFIWQLTREVLGKTAVSERSPYSREVLTWRLYDLLAMDVITSNPLCAEATRYWSTGQGSDDLKRYELSEQLADLFEQYLIYRPDWIRRWDKGEIEHWQAYVWQQLVQQDPNHPARLLEQAMASLPKIRDRLPERISLFGINALPPLWLQFFSELGKQTQVHLFHLNPCVEYWGELPSEKALSRQLAQWTGDEETLDVGNPLLANLGSQGRDFLRLLQDYTGLEFPVFEPSIGHADATLRNPQILQRVQRDILLLADARVTPSHCIDESICLVSAHSALREIQALHDWLLHQFNTDSSLTPKDVLVMCPQIENYAPYVDAVFARGWDATDETAPPLPCSIADRSLKDSEPLIQAFSELLELPDSRFQVSQIMGYIRLPALQDKFQFQDQDIEQIEGWLRQAAVHWGIDGEHKGQMLDLDQCSASFSWEQGLRRLLLGFAHGDSESIYQGELLLPNVEGSQGLLLGRLIQLLTQLKVHARQLQLPRSLMEWKRYLSELKDGLFSHLNDDANGQQMIEQAIDDLSEFASAADFQGALPLTVIREFLKGCFSQPEPGRQFLAGQVTFCSMIPMRSVPFRVIAVLGLNDGEFPRQRIPMGFDLMAKEMPRPGDRSRRGDDRYLFLEALISAREKLYLSYQGKDVKNNNIREPSLVLRELMDYLHKGYGWKWDSEAESQLIQVPMQPFSLNNYQGNRRSFNAAWLRLSSKGDPRNNQVVLPALDLPLEPVPVETLVRFFDNPAKALANSRLKLYLGGEAASLPEDSEPFATDHLDRYVLQDAMVQTLIEGASVDELVEQAQLKGMLPETPNTLLELEQWQGQAEQFVDCLKMQGIDGIEVQQVSLTLPLQYGDIQFTADLPLSGNCLQFWRLASPKGKDDVRLWLHHLLASVVMPGKGITTQGFFRGDKDKEQFKAVSFSPVEDPQAELIRWLDAWQQGLCHPQLLNAQLGQSHGLKGPLTEAAFEKLWMGGYMVTGLGQDPYMRWFWPDMPTHLVDVLYPLEALYGPLYQHRTELSS